MKQIVQILSILLFIPFLLACVAAGTPPSTLTPTISHTPSTTPEPGFNLLVMAEGKVQLQRGRWTDDFHPTAFGAILERGDLLQVPHGAKATVLCDSLTLWPVPTGAPAGVNNGCPEPPPPEKILVSGSAEGITIRLLGGGISSIPYTISPRSTDLLSQTPTLRWNDTGATSYTVQVRGGDLQWRQASVTGNQLIYPGEPALQPGVPYILVVEDSQGNSSQDEGKPGLGFKVLPDDQANQIKTYCDRITDMNLSNEAKVLAQAQLYAGHGLTAEAIEILEGLVQQGSQQAAIHRTLADLYNKIDLAALAEPRYLAALKLAETQGNVEAVADIQASLGKIYAIFAGEAKPKSDIETENKDKAIRYLNQAKAGYEALGDKEKADEIAKRLAGLQ